VRESANAYLQPQPQLGKILHVLGGDEGADGRERVVALRHRPGGALRMAAAAEL
jgi:hypothetical protein